MSSYFLDRLAFSDELPGQTGSLAHIGNDKDFLSTRISDKLNLTGPSINVQTACSTSLVAVHLACQAILAGECDLALAGAERFACPSALAMSAEKVIFARRTDTAARSTPRRRARFSAAASARFC